MTKFFIAMYIADVFPEGQGLLGGGGLAWIQRKMQYERFCIGMGWEASSLPYR